MKKNLLTITIGTMMLGALVLGTITTISSEDPPGWGFEQKTTLSSEDPRGWGFEIEDLGIWV